MGADGPTRSLTDLGNAERLAARHTGERLHSAHLDGLIEQWPAPVERERTLPELLKELCEAERREILDALTWSGGNVARAARRLRIPRGTLRHRMRKHALELTPPAVR